MNDDAGAPIEPAANELPASRLGGAFLAGQERADGTLSRTRLREEEAEADALLALVTASATSVDSAPAVAASADLQSRRSVAGRPLERFRSVQAEAAAPRIDGPRADGETAPSAAATFEHDRANVTAAHADETAFPAPRAEAQEHQAAVSLLGQSTSTIAAEDESATALTAGDVALGVSPSPETTTWADLGGTIRPSPGMDGRGAAIKARFGSSIPVTPSWRLALARPSGSEARGDRAFASDGDTPQPAVATDDAATGAPTNAAAGSSPFPTVGTTRVWTGSTGGDWNDASNWTTSTSGAANNYPQPGDNATVASGTTILYGDEATTGGTFDSIRVTLGSATSSPATLDLDSATTGYNFGLAIDGNAQLLAQGTGVFAGYLDSTGANSLVLGSTTGGDLVLHEAVFSLPAGTLTFTGTTTFTETFQTANLYNPTTNGVLQVSNTGTVDLVGASIQFGQDPTTSTADVAGNGTFNIGSQSTLGFDGSVASTLTVNFSDVDAKLALADPSTFQATVTNFAPGDAIDFTNLTATSATYDASTDQLTVSDGTTVVATLNDFHGQQGTFAATSDGSSGGTTISFAGANSPADHGASGSAEAVGALQVQSTLTMPGSSTAINGAGEKIGIISDSFNYLGGAANAVAAGYLPGTAQGTTPVTVLKDQSEKGDTDEGQAMAEAIYQDAPEAQLYFYTSGDTPSSFASAVTALQNAGCNIIVDDVGFDQDANDQVYGPDALAAQSAVSSGVNYFSAIGNDGDSFYSGAFNPKSVTLANGTTANANIFDNGTPYEAIKLFQDVGNEIEVRWAAPYAGTGGAGAPNALTCELFNASGTVVATSKQEKSGTTGLAETKLSYENTGAAATYYLAVYNAAGQTVPASFSLLIDNDGANPAIYDPLAGNTAAGSGYGVEVVPGVNTVGAVFYGETPAFGQQTPSNEGFSSYGPGQLLYDSSGNALATPQTLSDPSFSAPDGQYTTSLGSFLGTSDAAPQAAAVAALMLQADPRLVNTQVSYLLAQTAMPFGDDSAQSGAGLIQAVPAVKAAITAATTPIWTAQDGTTTWSDPANWSDDAVPGSADTAQITNGMGLLTGAYNVTYDPTSSTIGGLTIDGGTTTSPNLTIGAGTALSVSGTTTITDNGTLTVAGSFTSSQITLGDTGTVALTSSGIGNVSGPIGGSGAVVQEGSGTTVLSGTNTYTGTTTVTSGTLQAGSTGAFSASSNYTLDGTLDLSGFSNSVSSIAGNGTITNNGGVATTLTVTGNGASSGTAFTGTLADGNGQLALTVDADKEQSLFGTSTYSGATTVDGILQAESATALSANSDYTVGQNGSLDVDADATIGSLAGFGQVEINDDSLTIGADNASTTYAGTLGGGDLVKVGTGTLTLSSTNYYDATTIDAGTLELGTPGAAGMNDITFAGSSGSPAILALQSAAQPGNDDTFANTLTDFADDDELDLENLKYDSLAPEPIIVGSGGTLAVSEDGQTEDFSLGGTHADLYYARADSSGNGTLVTDSPVCFASGTRIRTMRGDVAVEALEIGDLAVTSSGAPRPIRWLGHRTIDGRAHPRPREVMPVRIAAHAFAPNRPARDLLVSPGHAICLDLLGEVLIPVGKLVNGATIARHPVESVTYWHVELDSHDVLLAENLPAESFLDCGNRAALIEQEGDYDRTNGSHTPADFCRPFYDKGVVVEAARARLADRAEAQGWRSTHDMDLHLVIEGERIEADVVAGVARFLFPAAARDVVLASKIFVPSDLADCLDDRRLGVSVNRIEIEDGLTVRRAWGAGDAALATLFHPEEAAGEAAHSFTDGRAALPPALWDGCRGFVVLRVGFAGTPHWLPPGRAEPGNVVALRVA